MLIIKLYLLCNFEFYISKSNIPKISKKCIKYKNSYYKYILYATEARKKKYAGQIILTELQQIHLEL